MKHPHFTAGKKDIDNMCTLLTITITQNTHKRAFLFISRFFYRKTEPQFVLTINS